MYTKDFYTKPFISIFSYNILYVLDNDSIEVVSEVLEAALTKKTQMSHFAHVIQMALHENYSHTSRKF